MSLLKKLSQYGGKQAIYDCKRKLSYAQLYRASWALASQMTVKLRQAKKWPIENPKVLYMTNRDILHPMTQFATWHLNGVCIPISSSSKPSEIEYLIDNSQADIVVCHQDFAKSFEQFKISKNIPVYPLSDADIDLQCKSLLQKHGKVLPDKMDAMIIYTSGTTGNPKGVVHTHGSLEAQMIAMENAWLWTEDDHILNVLPLHHVHGIMNVLNTSLWSGAQCTMIPKYDDRTVLKVLLEEKDGQEINVFMAVPTIYKKLIEEYEKEGLAQKADEIKRKFKHLRLMVSGSSALPESLFKKWKEISGHSLLERFGMTETGMVLTNPYENISGRNPGFVGQPFPGTNVGLLDHDTLEVHNQFDREGELVIQSKTLFDRYLNNPKATEESYIVDSQGNKWFKSGDCAILQSDKNSYKILGRFSQDIIKKAGYKISALDIESNILQNDSVKECAVVGVPDEKYGEEIVAFIVLKDKQKMTPSQAEKILNEHIKQLMSNYKIPRVWKFIDELPRNQMGKISKKDLKKLA